jgi:hypothetical protein
MAVVSIKNKLRRGNLLVGNTAFDPAAMDSIATVTVGSGGSSTVEFTSIASTYSHLQVRISSMSSTGNWNKLQFNTDTGSNYTYHQLEGNGSTVVANSGTSQTSIQYAYSYSTTNPLGAVIDILDYANTNKYKTVRTLSGNDSNGSGNIQLMSGLWLSTSAITSIKFINTSGNFNQYSHFALYGIASA